MPRLETVDAVVIGANIRGLVTTYVASSLGVRTVLLEKGATAGGVDGSFVTAGGTRFDYGLHVLDDMRSPLATRLFTHVVDGGLHKVRLKRGVVLRNQIVPYAPMPSQMPPELRRMFPSHELVDDLAQELPTRDRLTRCYGTEFTNLVFDEVLPSFRCENRHRAFGVDEARLLTNVYPWFFPRARRRQAFADASRTFHEKLRAGIDQYVLYPHEGGFAGFANGFLRHLDPRHVETLFGVGDIHVELEPGTHTVQWVAAQGRRFQAANYFWAASWPGLCRVLGIPCQETATDRFVLGSFRLTQPAAADYHELLVGDPRLRINRITFPARFRVSDEPLVQVEFAFPRAEAWPTEADYWRDTWLGDLRALGLLDDANQVEEFDFKTFPIHYNAFGMEGEPLREADPSLLRDSNIRPVAPSLANLNLNTHVPRTVSCVTAVLANPATPW